jgi:hypothetical protein
VGGAEEIQLTDADPPERDGPQVAPAGYGLYLNVGLVLLPLLPTLPRTSLGCTCRVHASGDKLRYGRLRPDVNHYLKRAFIEAANAICLMRRRHPHRHVSRLYERIARRKGHPKAIGAVAQHLAEATYWLLSKQEPYREPKSPAVSSTRDKRDFARAPGSSTFDCDIPWNTHHAALTAKIWLRRNGLMQRQRASPARIASGLAEVGLVMTRCARAL